VEFFKQSSKKSSAIEIVKRFGFISGQASMSTREYGKECIIPRSGRRRHGRGWEGLKNL
jgi:hypothetical protein